MPRSSPVPPKDRRRLIAFGAAVRAVRTDLGLSQERLAHKAKMDRTYVGGIERGERNPSLRNIWKLADALETKPTVLMAGADRLLRSRRKR